MSTVDRPVPFGVEVVRVETAAQMQAELERIAPACDIVVMAAAVADFRPVDPADHKLKKHDGPPEIVLEPTPDILAGLGANKPPGQTLVGFAAETDDLERNARSKLERKAGSMFLLSSSCGSLMVKVMFILKLATRHWPPLAMVEAARLGSMRVEA